VSGGHEGKNPVPAPRFPVTSQTGRVYPSEALVTLKEKVGKANADQLATVSKQRLFKRIGSLSAEDLQRVGDAVKIQLDLF
jgi:mRNA interferase MazF